ncbi:hypothetical protein QBC40DRAFT_259725 [Triangularia verruculosa]|uniref:Uncharacterized protein n=1 Tax=Triangularia verruculosa TaxID=2587418 RepID=A0AAN6X6U1_9PEZI|nr:hypothetical protein QBC40DRAFT_259725 [Triangularia verruculosa]
MDNIQDCIIANPNADWSRRNPDRDYEATTRSTESAVNALSRLSHTTSNAHRDVLPAVGSREAKVKEGLEAMRKALADFNHRVSAEKDQADQLESLRRAFRGAIAGAGGLQTLVEPHDDPETAKLIFQLAYQLSRLSQYQPLLKELKDAGSLAAQGITASPQELTQETIKDLQVKVSQSQGLVQDLQVKLSKSQGLVQDLQNEMISVKKNLYETEQKANKAKNKAKDEKTERLILRREIITALQTVSATQQDIESLNKRFADLQEEHAGCAAEHQLHNETGSQLERTNSDLEQALADSERKRKRMEDDNERNQRVLVGFLTRSVRIKTEDSELAEFAEAIQDGDTCLAAKAAAVECWTFNPPWGPGVTPLPPGDGQSAVFTQVSMELYSCMRQGRWDGVATRLAHEFCEIAARERTINFGFVELVMNETIAAGEVKPRSDWTAAAYSCWLAIAHAAYILHNRCKDAGVARRLQGYLDKFRALVNSSWARAVLLGADESEAEPNLQAYLEIKDQDVKIVREETAEKRFILVLDLIRRTVRVTCWECWALDSVDNAINIAARPGEVAETSFDINSQEEFLWYLDNILG